MVVGCGAGGGEMLGFLEVLIFYLIQVMKVRKESYGENSEKRRGRPAVCLGNPGSHSRS